MITKKEILVELYRREIKKDLWSFCLHFEKDFFTKREYPLKEMAGILQNAYEQGLKVALSTPPRTGKSTLINYFVAWVYLNDTNNHILRASYSKDLSSELNLGVRDILKNPKYIELLGKRFIFTEDTKTKLRLKESHRANLFASSVGGSLTGFGGNITIADDLYKDHVEALSETINNKTIIWYQSSLQSRLDTTKQVEIVIGTRWRNDELVDDLEKKNYFDIVYKVKALTDDNKSFNENIITTDKLLERKRVTHSAIFNSMYQQEPMTVLDPIIEEHLIRYVDAIPKSFDFTISVLDLADAGSDRTALPFLGVDLKSNTIYAVDLITRPEMWEDITDDIYKIQKHYNCNFNMIESNKETIAMKKYANRLKKADVEAETFITTKNKKIKILMNARKINNIVFLNTDDEEYNLFIKNILKYDANLNNQHDDEIDSLAMAVEFIETIKENLN